jgi:tetratricopeptide (TPR) repeat protein
MKRLAGLVLALLFSAGLLLAQANPYSTMGIQGEVQLPDGKPAKNIYIQLQPQNGGGMLQWTTTDSAGHFDFDSAGAGGNYQIIINVQGFAPVQQLVMLNGPVTYVSITLTPLPGHSPPAGGTVSVANAGVSPKALEEYNRGLLAADQGKPKEAEEAFLKAIKMYPSFAASYMHLSALYADQGRFPDADKAIGKALKLAKNSSQGYAYLGYVYLREKQVDKAEQSFEKSLSIAKDDWFAQLELGRLRYDQGKYANAYPHLVLAHQLHPQISSVHLLLYNDLIRLRRNREALAELDDFLHLFPKAPEAAKLRKVREALAAVVARQH